MNSLKIRDHCKRKLAQVPARHLPEKNIFLIYECKTYFWNSKNPVIKKKKTLLFCSQRIKLQHFKLLCSNRFFNYSATERELNKYFN